VSHILRKIEALFVDQVRVVLDSGDELRACDVEQAVCAADGILNAVFLLVDTADRPPRHYWRVFARLLSSRDLKMLPKKKSGRLRRVRFECWVCLMRKLRPELRIQLRTTVRANACAGNWHPVFGVLWVRRLLIRIYCGKLWIIGLQYRYGCDVDLPYNATLASIDSLIEDPLFFSRVERDGPAN
jgi:hypothetical protein